MESDITLFQVDKRAPSITSITSFYNRQTFVKWRKKIGESEPNKITKVATDRGTKFHDLVEQYLLNEDINSLDVLQQLKHFSKKKIFR